MDIGEFNSKQNKVIVGAVGAAAILRSAEEFKGSIVRFTPPFTKTLYKQLYMTLINNQIRVNRQFTNNITSIITGKIIIS